jgi:hypothetical protein
MRALGASLHDHGDRLGRDLIQLLYFRGFEIPSSHYLPEILEELLEAHADAASAV